MKHTMEMAAEYLGVERGGIEFRIAGDGEAIGRLAVSNAKVTWYPKHSKKKCASMSWEEFDALMADKVK